MANKPLRMQKIKQILLLTDRGYSQRSIEKQTGVNRRTIAVYLQRLKHHFTGKVAYKKGWQEHRSNFWSTGGTGREF